MKRKEDSKRLTINFRARLDKDRFAKVQQLMQQTGYTSSQLLRALVDSAEVEAEPIIHAGLSIK